MDRPKINEVDYHEFGSRLQKAIDAGKRLEKTDGQPWEDYVSENGINEVAMMAWGRSKFDNPKAVVINDGSTWAGYYVFSASEEMVLKWIKPGS